MMTQKNFKGIKEELNFWIKENFKSKNDDTMKNILKFILKEMMMKYIKRLMTLKKVDELFYLIHYYIVNEYYRKIILYSSFIF
jgi:hypothetical protein